MPLQTPGQAITDFFKGFIGQQPVYSNGKRIGYFMPDKTGVPTGGIPGLCAGYIVVDKTGETTDPNTWTTNDFLGRQIPVSQYCAVKGIVANWLSPAQKGAAKQLPTGKYEIPGVPTSTPLLPPLPAAFGDVGKVAAFGAVGVAVLLLALRR